MKSKKKQVGVKASATTSNFQAQDSIAAGDQQSNLLKTHNEGSLQAKLGQGSVLTGKGEVTNEKFEKL